MKYKIGDTLFYNYYTDVLIPCKILNYYPKTNKYRIEHNGNSIPGRCCQMVKEADLYTSKFELMDSVVLNITNQISFLQEQLIKAQEKRDQYDIEQV